jgi:hypothetical protein
VFNHKHCIFSVQNCIFSLEPYLIGFGFFSCNKYLLLIFEYVRILKVFNSQVGSSDICEVQSLDIGHGRYCGFLWFLLVNARIVRYCVPKLFSPKFFSFHRTAHKVLEFSFSQSGVCFLRKYSDAFFQRLLTMLTVNTFLV